MLSSAQGTINFKFNNRSDDLTTLRIMNLLSMQSDEKFTDRQTCSGNTRQKKMTGVQSLDLR
jgi:hypothetical protein